jgi:hypothetical protein
MDEIPCPVSMWITIEKRIAFSLKLTIKYCELSAMDISN